METVECSLFAISLFDDKSKFREFVSFVELLSKHKPEEYLTERITEFMSLDVGLPSNNRV